VIIADIDIAEGARETFHRQLAACRTASGESAGLVYVTKFVERDGTTVSGFTPGYMVGAVSVGNPDRWVEGRLPDGMTFRFMPVFSWNPDLRYSIDFATKAYTLFAITPVA
jgi:hypothetical protein